MSSVSAQPAVSVILCTYNPVMPVLEWAVESLRNQTLSAGEFEFILVDNNSEPSVQDQLRGLLPGLRPRIIREFRQGLVHARIAGIRAASAPLIVFVDDDNHLDPTYLDDAIAIARADPKIGCFGGETKGVLETSLPEWKVRLLPYVGVRDYGEDPITSARDEWGEWEPIGAGMVCRKDVAEEFISLVENRPEAQRLGRAGRAAMSGEDSLIAHAAYRLGYLCSYQPRLKLSHWIKKRRTSLRSFARIVAGHGRSQAVLQTVKGRRVPRPALVPAARHLATRYYEHVLRDGLGVGTVKWCWEYGFIRESRRIGS